MECIVFIRVLPKTYVAASQNFIGELETWFFLWHKIITEGVQFSLSLEFLKKRTVFLLHRISFGELETWFIPRAQNYDKGCIVLIFPLIFFG